MKEGKYINMNNQLKETLLQIIENGNEEELIAIKAFLEGIATSRKSQTTYINSMFQFSREWQGEKFIMKMPINPLTFNNLGIVHGGVTATLIDTAIGTHANLILDEHLAAVTTDLQVRYLKVASGKELICESTLLHKGRQTIVLEGKVMRDDGTLCAVATGNFFIVSRK
ncbi:PaaI family thioesterase [Peribacillus acanthi]|uniref:PaaI family thioesterase n=1 Tax=Peribacillus acanthi TaxID=2171554 RepID=UPI000D3ED2C2|nr:PaaI family thioesterase [Peribacillus acanthi]